MSLLKKKNKKKKQAKCNSNIIGSLHHKKNSGQHLLGNKKVMNVCPRMICTAVTSATTNNWIEVRTESR